MRSDGKFATNQPFGSRGRCLLYHHLRAPDQEVGEVEQTRTNSPHYGCGMRHVEDGLQDKDGKGRLREVYEIVKLSDTGKPVDAPVEWRTTYTYDLLDKLTGYTDSQNNRKFMFYDGLSRMYFMNNPDRGYLWQAYDDAGNLLRTRDAKGQEIAFALTTALTESWREHYTTPEERQGNDLVPGARWILADTASPHRDPTWLIITMNQRKHWNMASFGNSRGARAATAVLNEEYQAELDVNQDGKLDVAMLLKRSRIRGPALP